MVVTIPRPDYLQCGVLIPKGTFEGVKATGLPASRERIVRSAPPLAEVVDELTDWDSVKLLTVQIDLLRRWSVPGALCIGDAAHAMSPAFGVGINYAVQDAVATANLLVPVLRATPSDGAALDAGGPARAAAAATPDRDDAAPPGGRPPDDRSGRELVHDPPNRFERTVPGAVLSALRPLTARLIGYGFRPERISDEVLSGVGRGGPRGGGGGSTELQMFAGISAPRGRANRQPSEFGPSAGRPGAQRGARSSAGGAAARALRSGPAPSTSRLEVPARAARAAEVPCAAPRRWLPGRRTPARAAGDGGHRGRCRGPARHRRRWLRRPARHSPARPGPPRSRCRFSRRPPRSRRRPTVRRDRCCTCAPRGSRSGPSTNTPRPVIAARSSSGRSEPKPR